MSTTTTMTTTALSSPRETHRNSSSTTSTSNTVVRPRRSSSKSVSKHLNLWRDIDSPYPSQYSDYYYNHPSTPPYPITLLKPILPKQINNTLENVSPQTYDLVIATFFSALAIVVLSIMFVGPRIGIITSIMGTYTLGFGIVIGAGQLFRFIKEKSRIGIANDTSAGAGVVLGSGGKDTLVQDRFQTRTSRS